MVTQHDKGGEGMIENRDEKIDGIVNFIQPFAYANPSPTYAAQLILKSNTNL